MIKKLTNIKKKKINIFFDNIKKKIKKKTKKFYIFIIKKKRWLKN